MDELESLMSDFEESLDVNQQATKKIIEMLYDDSKIFMTARLNPERMEHIIKNVIVLTFYQKFYQTLNPHTERKTRIETMDCICGSKCDFCNGKKLENEIMYAETIANENSVTKKFKDHYAEFINDMLKLTVSEGGKGRKEGVDIVLNNQRIMEKEKQMEMRRPIV